MNVSAHVDWLTFTSKHAVEPGYSDQVILRSAITRAAAAVGETGDITFLAAGAMKGYMLAASFADKGCRVGVRIRGDLVDTIYQYSGSVLAKSQTQFLIHRHLSEGHRCTRADFAFDVVDSGAKIEHLYDQYRTLVPAATQDKLVYIKGAHGDTLYIGSRSSDRMLRIYDKAAEQRVPMDWIRVEIEVKGDRANALRHMDDFLPHAHAAAVVKKMRVPFNGIAMALEEFARDVSPFTPAHKPAVRSDRAIWFEGQVSKAFRNWLKDDETAAVSWLRHLYLLYSQPDAAAGVDIQGKVE